MLLRCTLVTGDIGIESDVDAVTGMGVPLPGGIG
jgi:hypothetical protein